MKLRRPLVLAGLAATWTACSLGSSHVDGFGGVGPNGGFAGAGGGGPPFDASAPPAGFACGSMLCPVTALEPLDGPHGVAVDSDAVYVTQPTDGIVTRVSRTNQNSTILATGQDMPWGIAVDGSSVYWTNLGSLGTGSVMRAPKLGGGSPQTLATGLAHPRGIAADVTGVYVAVAGGAIAQGGEDAGEAGIDAGDEGGTEAGPGLGTTGAVLWLPVGGGAMQVLATSSFAPDRILVDDMNVYWTEPLIAGAARIMTVPKGGPAVPHTFVDMQPVIVDFAMDAMNLYWLTGGGGGTVMSMGKPGGGVPSELVTGLDHATALTTDGVGLWWANGGTGPVVMMSDTSGNNPIEVAPSGHVVAMSVDTSTTVFWTQEGVGAAQGEIDSVMP